MRNLLKITAFIVLQVLVGVSPVLAQQFGRNKVQYDRFEFRSFQTPHFEFYFYPEAKDAVADVSRMGERWYRRHSRTFLRDFHERKPIIFYANDADFQQTNVIGGHMHHLDLEFYDKYFEKDSYHDLHREHFKLWHPEIEDPFGK